MTEWVTALRLDAKTSYVKFLLQKVWTRGNDGEQGPSDPRL